jgi:hypothetical protein
MLKLGITTTGHRAYSNIFKLNLQQHTRLFQYAVSTQYELLFFYSVISVRLSVGVATVKIMII